LVQASTLPGCGVGMLSRDITDCSIKIADTDGSNCGCYKTKKNGFEKPGIPVTPALDSFSLLKFLMAVKGVSLWQPPPLPSSLVFYKGDLHRILISYLWIDFQIINP
jgi:hypothetical protein